MIALIYILILARCVRRRGCTVGVEFGNFVPDLQFFKCSAASSGVSLVSSELQNECRLPLKQRAGIGSAGERITCRR